MTDRLLTPSKITAWLDCAHFLTLRNRVDAGTLTVDSPPFGSFAQLLLDKGNQHEADCLAEYRRRGLEILEIPERQSGESFAAWVDRIGDPFDLGFDVIYQMPFIHEGVQGIADFLVRVEDSPPGFCAYEPVDAKLARVGAKPGHVLQLCFYADALQIATGAPPKNLHIWLGSGHVESLVAEEFHPYWNRLKTQLTSLLDDNSSCDTVPVPCPYCEFCEFAEVCTAEWRGADSLIYVAGIRGADRSGLEASDVDTLAELAVRTSPVDAIGPERLRRLVDQASLQAQARTDPDAPSPYRIIETSEDPTWGRGLQLMPKPDDSDIFLDFEGDPFWRADVGLFFLFGLIIRKGAEGWVFQTSWAHDQEEEAAATAGLIEFIAERRARFPGMHVYHYNHTERSSLERLTADYGVGEAALATLVETGSFIDLYPIVRNAVQVGTESYGLKSMEILTGYARGHDIDQGSGAVVEYEKYMADQDAGHLDRIAAYNEDDVRSTLTLRDWLIALRPKDLEWRASFIEPDEGFPDLDAQVAQLHSFGPDTPEHLLADLLGYWLRERRADKAPKLAKTAMDTPSLLDDPDVIAGLTYFGQVERIGKYGKPILPAASFRWPDQAAGVDFDPARKKSVLYSTPDGPAGYADIERIDRYSRELDLIWNKRSQELAVIPSAVVIDGWVSARPKPEALSELAATIIDSSLEGEPNRVSMALLRRDRPVFEHGKGPPNGQFADDLESIVEWARHLDHSYMAIQGPPGTGKTFRGARIVHNLICKGKRVGITAMSHHAIDNLLNEVVKVFAGAGDLSKLKAVRRGPKPPDGGLPSVEYASGNPRCGRREFNLVAGTTWLFAGNDMKDAPVDVLIVDEAGQLALADAIAASRSAHNLVLLGDPLQLPQVSKASHPGGGGRSVLEHVLGDDITIPPDRGVFLSETWRMHPDVCRFISERIYEGRLHSYRTTATQDTEFGTGLRWLKAEHADRSTESIEEAVLVTDEILGMMGSNWINQKGEEAPLTVADFMVVAPYNDQVAMLRDHLDADSRTLGVRVGTVDKFQGREAPVVFFTMTTSSAEDIPRGPDFLFSRNRLNVAISRARCLVFLVCTESLLSSRARDVDEMRLISTLCAFVEYATPMRHRPRSEAAKLMFG